VTGPVDQRRRDEVRALWAVTEPLHSIVYFGSEHAEAMRGLGLRGWWMGYFASRSAPLGEVPVAVVSASHYTFRPSMVARALPDAWTYSTPQAVLAARLDAVERMMAGLDPEVVAELAELLVPVARSADCAGRPLAAANQDLELPASPAGRLWWAATVLREHRGEGHVAALVAHGVGRLEALVLARARSGVEVGLLRRNRGWSESEWEAAEAGLAGAGLLAGDRLTAAGAALHEAVERSTDTAAAAAWPSTGLVELYDRAVALSGALVGPVVPAVTPVGSRWPPPPLPAG